ncbi:MAG TPA: hypothetical protein VI753_07960 [Anaerolineales bacterium]|nr:hypothetical protein [Anaerolineales bacterium]
MEHWHKLVESLPFVLQVGQSNKLNKTRLLETIISAAIIGGVLYGTFKTDMENVKSSITEVKQDMKTLSQRIDRVLEKQ